MSEPESRPVYSRTQKIVLVVLICTLAAGLFLLKHIRAASSSPFALSPGDQDAYAFKVDINKAPWREIACLPGIGDKKAQAIVAERDLHGPFVSVDDLARVSGIGPKTIEDIKPFVAVGKTGE